MRARKFPQENNKPLRLRLGVRRSVRRGQLSPARLRRAALAALRAGGRKGAVALSIWLVGEQRMRSLNRQYAGNDYATDVLAFAALEGEAVARRAVETELGDVVICLPQASRQARTARHSVAAEVDLLVAHGVLHLLGFDHDTRQRSKAMESAQACALARI